MGCGASDAHDTGASTPPHGAAHPGTYAAPPLNQSNELKKSQDRPTTATETMVTIKVDLGTVTAMGTFQGKQVGHVYISDSATIEDLHRKIRNDVIKTKRATQLLDLNPKKTIKQNKLKNGASVSIIFDDEDPNGDTYDEYAGYEPSNATFVDIPVIG